MKAMAEAAGGTYRYGESFTKGGFYVSRSIGFPNNVSVKYMYDDVIGCTLGTFDDDPADLGKKLTEWIDGNPFVM